MPCDSREQALVQLSDAVAGQSAWVGGAKECRALIHSLRQPKVSFGQVLKQRESVCNVGTATAV